MSRVVASLVCAAVLAGLLTGAAGADQPRFLTLQSGHSMILQTPGLTQVAVGDNRVAAAIPVGTAEVVVNAKGPGHTSIFIWYGGERESYELTVTPQALDDIASMIRSAINEPHVSVVDFGHAVVVRGSVADNAAFARISDIVGRFAPYAIARKDAIVNAVVVRHPLGTLQQRLARMPGVHDIRLDGDAKGNVIVSGRVHDQTQAQMVIARAQGLAGAYLAAKGKVIDRLEVETTSQIDVKVFVLEVDKTGLSQLGVRLQSANPVPNNPGGGNYSYGDPIFPVIENPTNPNTPGRAFNLGSFFRISLLAPTLDLLIGHGDARVLSSPDLVTIPGKNATFLVGGEIPYIYSTGNGQVSVMFKKYGVQLKVTPTILANGSVESVITPIVSDLDYAHAVTLFGTLVPALTTSTLSTDIVTKSGQGIVMGGLLRHLQQKTIEEIPILSRLPILGRLFRSVRYQNDQSDVVFVLEPVVITQ